ncbi:MAG TPA: cytochrome c [Thermoanaerobaculia bacterium]
MRLLTLVLILFTSLAALGNEAGANLYKGKACITCHGADGSGNTPTGKSLKAGDLRSDTVQKQTDEQLEATIANGKGKMPSYKSAMNAAQIKDVVTYLRSFAKKP